MGSIERRLGRLEEQIRPRATPEGGAPWRTPEQEAAREEQFRHLYMQIGAKWPPEPKSNTEEAFEELFTAIARYRDKESTDERSNNA